MSLPSEAAHLLLYPTSHVYTRQSQLNFTHPEQNAQLPLTTLSRQPVGLLAELEPGDLLYLPAMVFHQVTALTGSLSVNVFRPSPAADTLNTIRSMGVPGFFLKQQIATGGAFVAALANLLWSVLRYGLGEGEADTVAFLKKMMLARYEPLAGELACADFREAACPELSPFSADVGKAIGEFASDVGQHLNNLVEYWRSTQQDAKDVLPSGAAADTDGYILGVRDLILATYAEDLLSTLFGSDRVCLFLRCMVSSWKGEAANRL